MAARRENFNARTSERWQPPAFRAPRTRWDRLLAAARRVVDLQAASAWRDLKVELANVHGDLLDVGAGAQPYRPLLPRDVRYRAIDVAAAAEAFGYDVPDTEYFEGESWPVADRSVDVVLATETLEHVLEPWCFLAEAHRVLRPGGRLILTVPFSARWHYVPYDYWRFTPSGLGHLLDAAGFTTVIVSPRGNELTVACSKLAALVVPWLLPPEGGISWRRALSLLMLPPLAVLTVVAHASMQSRGGDDCLGWTATAVRPFER